MQSHSIHLKDIVTHIALFCTCCEDTMKFGLLKRKFKIQKIHSKLAQLLILWLLVLGFNNEFLQEPINQEAGSYILIAIDLLFFLFPLLGIVTDVWAARLKLMKLSVLATIPCLLIGLCSDVLIFQDSPNVILKLISGIAFTIPFSFFRTNIVPLYVEQMLESPSSEVSAAISWHVFALILPALIVKSFVAVFTKRSELFIAQLSTLLATLYILPCSYSVASMNTYNDYPLRINPCKLIFNMLKFLCQKHRRVLLYSEDAPQGLDKGKQRYGGPFREDEVEDVKSVKRIVPIILVSVLGHASFSVSAPFVNSFVSRELDIHDVTGLPTILIFHSTILLMILAHQFLIKPCFSSYIPSMLKCIGTGLLISFFSTASSIALQISQAVAGDIDDICNITRSEITDSQTANIISPILAVPLIANGICFCLIVITSLQFILAQSPASMRGLLVGVWYMAWGMGDIIKTAIFFISNDGCIFYCYVSRGVLGLVIFLLYLFLSVRYKLRSRRAVVEDDVLNINIDDVSIADCADYHNKSYGACEEPSS